MIGGDAAPATAARALPGAGVGPGYSRDLLLHLARRELSSMHRFTLLGAAWPLIRLLAQLAVFVFVFSNVLDLNIEDYPIFVFSGLVAWSWFSTGVSNATTSLVSQRHLVFQSRFPVVILPAVSVAVPLADVLVASGVLVVLLVASGDLSWTIVFTPVLAAVQLLLMCGIAWMVAAATVYLRDVRNAVTVGLTLLFYLTPVFYDLSRVPAEYHDLLRLNPLTVLVEGYRSVLIDGTIPAAGGLALVALASALLAGLGLLLFRRLEPGFVDEL